MRARAWIAIAFVAAACGAGGWGTANLDGLPGGAVDSVIVSTTSWDGGTANLPPRLDVELVENNGVLTGSTCHLYGGNGTLVGTAVYLSFTGGGGAVPTTGAYPIRVTAPDAGPYAHFSVTDWETNGGSYSGVDLGTGVDGIANLTQLDSQTVAGDFTATFASPDGGTSTLTGKFSGPFCIKQQ